MAASLVLTVVGPDRPGLVDSIASLVAGHDGNWLESRMSRLGGQFAGILRVEIPSERERAFVEELRGLQVKGLTLVVVPDGPGPGGASGQGWMMELVGQDRPGIVREISHALAARGVNVEDLHTECVSAPMSGETLFKARALVHVPPDCDPTELKQAMEKVAADLIVDIALSEVRAPA